MLFLMLDYLLFSWSYSMKEGSWESGYFAYRGCIRCCQILILGICILLHVLDQVQEFPSNATLFQ
jgi:hypothetical protein